MTRKLRVIDASRPEEVFVALREALTAGGAAVVPRSAPSGTRSVPEPGAAPEPWPSAGERVAQNVALVIETSGSTGVPKRVALSADALLASAAASASTLGGQGQWLLALPTHYVAGAQVLVRSLAAETEPILYGGGHFEAERFASLAQELDHDLRFTSLVPVQLARLVEAAEAGSRTVADALRRFDGILVGGQALSTQLRERAEAIGARIVSTYGSSETAGGCVYDGVPIGTAVVRTVDGQLEISGPMLAEGYLGDPDRTAAAFHEADDARWYRTGDLGSVDDAGRVTVLGRADNVIISGGEKVLLDAVERAVREHPGLHEAVVVAAEDARWGQVPVVVVEVSGEATSSATLEMLRRAVRERLGRAAAPARIVEVDRLPRLDSGKPDRVALARLAAALEA
ncbi:O-succinylbenzoic acid--CoA ligase [Leifsonia sp. 98AMF]|uniref:AMP-binding protein n=1 Tax=unclassified Leifsonia TaxID=2663824 RepID=UPI00087B5295|nr:MULTISPECIES: AMP-binding protein [unclassified Leifsonia]SDH02294.1 O-succinylbenzoic acid--CoA ligase [Leifsonia sp. 197AMF]SDJ39141.1 O-succinylbenzoic acid--CoA ligase [Leifsonia sp. 466MF]SDK39515.1 O-succinylbenzoic acid--CoA ligase [Leifsonia sp. 157MF]SDN59404.1 O-succinylbenzoic acid--CoA ligase [Leifsonia sp. 509MF]SEN49902.1 O-succinylbenzoic acid--CoA ligase [Leifsonia sp. 467MF]